MKVYCLDCGCVPTTYVEVDRGWGNIQLCLKCGNKRYKEELKNLQIKYAGCT